ncbi:MAG: protein kinase [Phycisphaerales bacterium]|nr:protein kinase [Phycisphaerales bacterium]
MTPTRFEKVYKTFQEALEHDVTERNAFLDKACGDDTALRNEVEKLLRDDEEATKEKFLVLRADDKQIVSVDVKDPMIGERIGPYEIRKLIDQGGMGSVYMAVRTDDFKQQVAIKLIKQGKDTNEILRRFQNERQILAGLKHPNIAQLLDGGNTEDGLPFFVMEYIEGERINTYCDKNKLGTLERLKLFRSVCDAVHFAHQNTVIHRDLKPGNILVTADGRPKLVDFGIAKLINREIGFQAMNYTQTEYRLMTPAYASPEQVRGDNITTASDIYSLGVVLYELLTGHAPYQLSSRLKQEIERIVCEEDPPLPSNVIKRHAEISGPDGTTTTITPESVSKTRDGQLTKLRRKLAGDIDKITLMALRKEPNRRYTSVEQLSSDIQRHLDGLPVIAQKSTVRYRAGKFVRRNRGLAISSAVVFAVTIIGAVVSGMSLARAAEEKKKTDRFLARQLLPDVMVQAYRDVNEAQANIEKALDLDPDYVKARIYQAYFLKRQSQLEDAIRVAKAIVLDYPERGEPHVLLGELLSNRDPVAADTHRNKGKELLRPSEHNFYSAFAITPANFNDYEEVVELLTNSLEKYPWDFDVLWQRAVYLHKLGRSEHRRRNRSGSRKKFEQMLADASILVKIHGEFSQTWELKGAAHKELGHLQKAIECFENAKSLDPDYYVTYYNSANTYYDLQDFNNARSDYKKAIRLSPRYYEPLVDAYHQLGKTHLLLGEYKEALDAFEKEIKLDPYPGATYVTGIASWFMGDEARALQDFDKAIKSDPENYALVNLWTWIIKKQAGDDDGASAILEAALEGTKKKYYRMIISLFQNPSSEKELLDLIGTKGRATQCETLFYVGLRALGEGDVDVARLRFKECLDTKQARVLEYILANWHLEKINSR